MQCGLNRKYSDVQIRHQRYFVQKGQILACTTVLTHFAESLELGNGLVFNIQGIKDRMLNKLQTDYLHDKQILRGEIT